MDNFCVVADGCVRQMRYDNIGLLKTSRINESTLEAIDLPKSDYRNNYVVSVSGRRLGILSLNHVKAVVDRDLAAFRYDNTTLYRNHVADMLRFVSDYQLQPVNITALEIAVDTNVSLISEYYSHFNNPSEYNYHYAPMTTEELRGTPAGESLLMVGNVYRDGTHNFTLYPYIAIDKKLKIYNKTLDIATKGKHYIADYHKLNGLDITQDVERVELTLLNSAFKSKETVYANGSEKLSGHQYKLLTEREKGKYEELVILTDDTPSIEDMCNSEKLLYIFFKYTNNLKAFSYTDNIRKTRCTPVVLLDLGTPKTFAGIEYIKEIKEYRNQMTATFKTLIRNFYTTGNNQYYKTAELLAKDTDNGTELEKQLKALAPLRVLYEKQAPATKSLF